MRGDQAQSEDRLKDVNVRLPSDHPIPIRCEYLHLILCISFEELVQLALAGREIDFDTTTPGPTSCLTGGCNGGLECDKTTGTVR